METNGISQIIAKEIKKTNKINHKNLKYEPDVVDVSSKNKKKKIAKAAVLTGVLLATTAILVYKHKQAKIMKEMPDELKTLFKELKGKNGQEFIDSAYEGIKKHLDLTDIAPQKVTLTDKADGILNTVTGGFNPIENTIEYSKGFAKKLTKASQFNLLSHELKHCKQFNTVLMTEGLGPEALAQASAKQSIWTPNFFGKKFGEEMMKSHPKEEAERLIKNKTDEIANKILPKIKENYSKTFEKPKIPASSELGQKAKQYIDAYSNYEGLSMFGIGSDKYKTNLLEKEAYEFGDKMQKLFRQSSSPLDKIKDLYRVIKDFK